MYPAVDSLHSVPGYELDLNYVLKFQTNPSMYFIFHPLSLPKVKQNFNLS